VPARDGQQALVLGRLFDDPELTTAGVPVRVVRAEQQQRDLRRVLELVPDRLERRLQDVPPAGQREGGEVCGADPGDPGAVGEVPQLLGDGEAEAGALGLAQRPPGNSSEPAR
jgi:hypothetical protein